MTTTAHGPKPRTGSFLKATIPASRSRYVETVTRAEQEQRPGTASPNAWPIRLTRCGEHPGRFGDNQPARRLQEDRVGSW